MSAGARAGSALRARTAPPTTSSRCRSSAQADADAAFADVADGGVKTGLTQIRMADRHFDLQQFLAGARAAFEMIVEAYATGDKAVLRPLLADDVYRGFDSAIDQRQAAGQTLETQLTGVPAVEVVDAKMDGDRAHVTVRFKSEQINLLKDAEGKIVEGDPQTAEEVIDLWTFERDTSSSDPNWTLVETRTPE